MITIIFLVISLLCSNMRIDAKPEQRIRLYAFYTNSHTALLNDWFLPSLKALHDDFELKIIKLPQECPSGVYGTQGYNTTMRRKVEMNIKAIQETMGSWFVCSDVDIQFFEPVKEDLTRRINQFDLIIQLHNPKGNVVCAGFFACKSNKRTLEMWQEVLVLMLSDPKLEDQQALNIVLRKSKNKVKWGTLPITYMVGRPATGGAWKPGSILPVPEGVKLHHANWTRGMQNKIAQLKQVRDTVAARLKDKEKNETI
jgi:hypothetical protein